MTLQPRWYTVPMSSLADDTRWLDATAQADLVRQGEVSPAELLEAAIERLDAPRQERLAVVINMVEPRRHQLRHGKEKRVLQEIAGLTAPAGEAAENVRREQNYFASQAGRMNYQKLHRRGWPIGSGPVESACRQRQVRAPASP